MKRLYIWFASPEAVKRSIRAAAGLVVVLVFLLPYERIPSLEIIGTTIRLSQVTALALVVVSIPYVARKYRLLLAPQYMLLGLFMFTYLLSALLAPNLTTALKTYAFTAFVATTATVVSLIPSRENQLTLYEKALLLTSALVLAVGFYQYFGDIFGLSYQLTGLREAYTKSIFGFPRIQSTALEPLFLASFLLIPLLVLASKHIVEDRKLFSARTALIIVIAATIFLTVSRGAIIGLACSTVFLTIFTVRKSWRGLLKYLALLTTAALLAFSLTAVESPFSHTTTTREKGSQKQQRLIEQTTNLDSQSDRSRNRNLAIEAFKSAPLFGIGPGNFNDFAKERFPEYRTMGNPAIVVNNLPLEILAESGLVGFISLAAFLGYLFFCSIRVVRQGKESLSIWALGLSAYMVATAVQYQTFSTFYIMHIWVVIGLLMAIILGSNSDDIKFPIKLFTQIMSLISRSKAHARSHTLFYGIAGFFLLVYLVFSYFSYRKFMFPMLDLGLFNRHMWGMVRADFGPNTLKLPTELNLLGDHSHFILLLLAPLYALYQSPVFLVLTQIIALVASGYPIYKIALKHSADKRIAALWLIPYFMFFGFWSGLSYPFHEVFLALPLIAWALYFLLEDRFKPMVVCLGLLLLVKENMPLLVIMFGLYVIVMRRQYKKGGLLIGVGAAYFVAVTQYWLPWFGTAPYVYSDNVFGKGTADVARAAIQTPKEFVRQLFLPLEKTKSIVLMLASFGGLPLIGLEVLILLAPLWLGRFLSTQPWRWSVIQHYSVDQAPILAVAAIIGTYRLYGLARKHNIRISKQAVGVMAVGLCIVGSIASHLRIDERYPWRLVNPSFYTLSESDRAAWMAIGIIPKDASVAAQAAFPQLSSRKEIYNLPIDIERFKPDYLVASENYDMWPFGGPNELQSYVKAAQLEHGYNMIFSQSGTTVLQRAK